MPKLMVSEHEMQNRRTRAVIHHNMELYGISIQDLSKAMGCSRKTVYNKISNPDTITLSEFRTLHVMLKVKDDQLMEFEGMVK